MSDPAALDLLAQTVETSAIPQDELLSAARLVEALRRAGKANEALELVRKYGDGWAPFPAPRPKRKFPAAEAHQNIPPVRLFVSRMRERAQFVTRPSG